MTIDEATGAHWRPALRGAYVLLTEAAHAADRSPPGPCRPRPTSRSACSIPASPDAVALVAPFWADVWERGVNWLLHAGQYEYTPDHRPFVGPTPVDGLWLNGGWSGHGVMGSGGGSRLLMDAITGTATGPEWGLRGGRTGRRIRSASIGPMDVGRHDVL